MFEFDTPVVSMHGLDWVVVGAYIFGMLYIGYWFSKKSSSFDDYFMAGRGITAPLLVGTLVSTFYGLDTLFGTSEVGFHEGISAFFAYSLPYTALYVAMAFLSPAFKNRFPENSTMQDIAFQKYGDRAGIITSVASFIYSTNTMEMMGIGFLLHLVIAAEHVDRDHRHRGEDADDDDDHEHLEQGEPRGAACGCRPRHGTIRCSSCRCRHRVLRRPAGRRERCGAGVASRW